MEHPGFSMKTLGVTTGGKARERTAVVIAVGLLVLVGLCVRQLPAEDVFPWMPAEAGREELAGEGVGGEHVVREIVITETPKATADAAKFTREYVIDLKKFGIRNDGGDPAATSRGINAALQHAKTLGANRIVFPKGTYLISETDPIILDHRNTIVDLNGATLEMNSNGLAKYCLMQIIDGAEALRLTNGTLKGDRSTHDYNTLKSSHEGCTGLVFYGGKSLEVDRLTIRDFPGFSTVTRSYGSRTRPELLALIMYAVRDKDLEQGAFDGRGEKIPSMEKVRSREPFDITRCKGQFEFGYNMGYQGFPHIKSRIYQAYFYDADKKFLERKVCLQFKKVAIPERAVFMHLEFNQPTASCGKVCCGRITNFRPPRDVHFHDNVIVNNRALGLAFCGGQRWLIEGNRFERNGGQAPSFAIDLEDGWDMMQDVVLRKNRFVDNHNDLVICAGSELLIEGNEFQKAVVIYHRTYNYTVRGNRFRGGPVMFRTVTGVARMEGNRYEDCTLSIEFFNKKTIGDGFFHKPDARVHTPPLTFRREALDNVTRVSGTYFNFIDSDIRKSRFVAGKETSLIALRTCTVEDSSVVYEAEGPEVRVVFEKCKGRMGESGPGLKRKRVR